MSTLPPDFADLEPFADWALPSERNRYAKRLDSTMEELQAFYDATFPRLEQATEYLKAVELDGISEEDQNLLWLFSSLVTVSFPVEVWRQPRVPERLRRPRGGLGRRRRGHEDPQRGHRRHLLGERSREQVGDHSDASPASSAPYRGGHAVGAAPPGASTTSSTKRREIAARSGSVGTTRSYVTITRRAARASSASATRSPST